MIYFTTGEAQTLSKSERYSGGIELTPVEELIFLPVIVDEDSLIRGALLHDYFLYHRNESVFPLTPIPPKYKEAWIVCIADKYCAALEFLR